MSYWKEEHRTYAVEQYFLHGKSLVNARYAFRSHFNILRMENVPSAQLIFAWVKKFRQHSTLINIPPSGRVRSKRTSENIDLVRKKVKRRPKLSIRNISKLSGLSNATIQRILNDLNLHPYKIQIIPKLYEHDYVLRMNYSKEMLDILENADDNVVIIFSDEAHFHLGGYVNKQNMRYWSEDNPRELHEKEMHLQKTTVWCAISSKKIIGPYFYGHGETVTCSSYCQMLENFFLKKLKSQCPRNTIF